MQALNLVPTAGKREIVSSVGNHNCFIIQSSSLCFDKYLREAAIFTQERSQEGEKRVFIYTWTEYYLQPSTVGRPVEQTIICRQIFEGHLVGSRPMKRKKNLHRIIMTVTSALTFINK